MYAPRDMCPGAYSGVTCASGRTRCGAIRVMSRCRSDALSCAMADLTRCQVPQPAVDELRAPPARAVGEVAPLDEDRPKTPARGIQRDAGTRRTAADHEDVDDRIRRQRVELTGAGGGRSRAEGCGVRPTIAERHRGRTPR